MSKNYCFPCLSMLRMRQNLDARVLIWRDKYTEGHIRRDIHTGEDIHKDKHIHECIHGGGDIHTEGHIHGGDLHTGETYTRRDIHMEGHTHGGTHTWNR